MNTIDFAGQFSNDIATELQEIRNAAAGAQQPLRTLRDLEMGWVAGGADQTPTWG